MSTSSEPDRFWCCLNNWAIQQESDIEELLKGLKQDTKDEVKLKFLADTNMRHYDEYCSNRAILAQEDAPFFFCPTWGSSIENSHLWLAGSRPSLTIRLLYTLCGYQLESHLDEYLLGERKGDLGELSAIQLGLVDELQRRTIEAEERLSTSMASLQENVADNPLALLAYESNLRRERHGDADKAIGECAVALCGILEEADKLRVKTLREMVEILTPLQAVDFLVATMKLNLSVHQWGKTRDQQQRIVSED